jgi:hypothetical protein
MVLRQQTSTCRHPSDVAFLPQHLYLHSFIQYCGAGAGMRSSSGSGSDMCSGNRQSPAGILQTSPSYRSIFTCIVALSNADPEPESEHSAAPAPIVFRQQTSTCRHPSDLSVLQQHLHLHSFIQYCGAGVRMRSSSGSGSDSVRLADSTCRHPSVFFFFPQH